MSARPPIEVKPPVRGKKPSPEKLATPASPDFDVPRDVVGAMVGHTVEIDQKRLEEIAKKLGTRSKFRQVTIARKEDIKKVIFGGSTARDTRRATAKDQRLEHLKYIRDQLGEPGDHLRRAKAILGVKDGK